jgi:ABC-2 type transport system permease protein
MGDFIYGVLSFAVAGQYSFDAILRFAFGVACGTIILVAFLTLVQSLAFWMGNASMIAMQASNAIVTFALYPLTLFDGTAKLILFTVLPAAFIGSVPAEFVRAFSWGQLGMMTAAAAGLLFLSVFVFYRGLRRYESGSAIQVQV